MGWDLHRVAVGACALLLACSGAGPTPDPGVPPVEEPEPEEPSPKIHLPDLRTVPPSSVDVGEIGFLAGQTLSDWASIIALNAGTAPLRVHRIELRAGNENSSLGEIVLTYPPGAALALGTGRDDSKAIVGLRITPNSLGTKRWEVVLNSDDPDEPERVLEVLAEVVPPPPCALMIDPNPIDFGEVPRDTHRHASVLIRNDGTKSFHHCVVENVDLAPGPSQITLASESFAKRLLGPGDFIVMTLRVAPSSELGPVERILRMDVVRPDGVGRDHLEIPVRAEIVELPPEDCVVIAPGMVDFGSVHLTCASATKSFSIYNACYFPVRILGIDLVIPGQPQAPECLSTGNCDFFLTAAPTVSTEGLLLNPGLPGASVQVKFKPRAAGTHSAKLAVTARSSNITSTITADLIGRASAPPKVTESFVQSSPPDPSFQLTPTLDIQPASLEVTVDGVRVPQHTPTGPAWIFDTTSNVLEFQPGSVPQGGQMISVSYSAC